MDNIIEINHSAIIIHNYHLGDSQSLERSFAIWNFTTHIIEYKMIYYDEDNCKLYIPRGIDIHWLENKFPNYRLVMDDGADKYDSVEAINIKYLPRDEYQEEAMRFLLGLGEYKNNKYKSQLALNLNTGIGKTYCCITAVAYLRLRPIMITYSTKWLDQWKAMILEYTDIKPEEIYIIDGKPGIIRLLNRVDISKIKFILCTHSTIHSYGDSAGWDKVSELFKYMKVGLKIIDECHLCTDNMSMIDFFSNTRQTFYVSATPLRSDKDENKIYQLYFRNVPKIDLFDPEVNPHTTYIAIRFNSRPTPKQISMCKNMYGLNRSVYTEYLVKNPNFYKVFSILIDTVIKRTASQGKTLIFIGTNHAIDIVYNWMETHYPDLAADTGIFNSLFSSEEREIAKSKTIILSNTKSCGAAVDIKGLKNVIVLAEPFKSEVLARQTLGRCRDANTNYIDIVDDGFFYTKKFYYAKQQVFSKYALECKEIKFSDDELNQVSAELTPVIEEEIPLPPAQLVDSNVNRVVPGLVRVTKAKPNAGLIRFERWDK